jgi:hypothetical protein
MADYAAPNNAIETRSDLGTDPAGVVAFWLQQLKLAEREDRKFIKIGRKIVQRYRNETPRAATTRPLARFNVFWSNVETLKPILYGRTPKPDVQRRHKNNDAVARLGAEILERALSYEDDLDEFDDVMQCVVEDRLLAGRGVARVLRTTRARGTTSGGLLLRSASSHVFGHHGVIGRPEIFVVHCPQIADRLLLCRPRRQRGLVWGRPLVSCRGLILTDVIPFGFPT